MIDVPTSTYVVGGVVNMVAVLEPGLVRQDNNLSISILSFNYEVDGIRQQFAGAINQSVTDDSWNWVFLDYDGNLNINTTGFPTGTHIRLARVRCDNGLITSIVDERILLTGGIDKAIEYSKSEGQDSDTTGTPQEKLTLDLTGLDAGTYVIKWYTELRHSNNTLTEYASMTVTIDDTFEIGASIWPYNGWEDASGSNIYAISAGDHFVDIDFQVNGGGTAYIRRARLLVWRIA